MKFSVGAPLVALLAALILALLTLLAGIKHNFMPDTYIVQISGKSDDQGSNSAASHGPGRDNHTALRTSQPGDDPTNLDTGNAQSFTDHPGPSTSTISGTRPISPTRSSFTTDPHPTHPVYYIDGTEHQARMKSMDSVQGTSSTSGSVPVMERNDHVPGPGNNTSKPTVADDWDDLEDDSDDWDDTYTLYFLTNCQLHLKNTTRTCSKPWDFESHMLGSESVKDLNDSLPEEGEMKRMWERKKHNRDAFSKVHLTGCVLVGLSFLCTAASFFILPAFGKWISVGNLALATFATIFLLTSSIFTAVLAKKIQDAFAKLELSEDYDVKPAKKFQALV